MEFLIDLISELWKVCLFIAVHAVNNFSPLNPEYYIALLGLLMWFAYGIALQVVEQVREHTQFVYSSWKSSLCKSKTNKNKCKHYRRSHLLKHFNEKYETSNLFWFLF